MSEFKSLNGYTVKDETARAEIETVKAGLQTTNSSVDTLKSETLKKSDLASMFTTPTFIGTAESIAGGSYSDVSISCVKDGYKFLGVVGITLGQSACSVAEWAVTITNPSVTVSIRNNATSSMACNVTVRCLFVKNS